MKIQKLKFQIYSITQPVYSLVKDKKTPFKQFHVDLFGADTTQTSWRHGAWVSCCTTWCAAIFPSSPRTRYSPNSSPGAHVTSPLSSRSVTSHPSSRSMTCTVRPNFKGSDLFPQLKGSDLFPQLKGSGLSPQLEVSNPSPTSRVVTSSPAQGQWSSPSLSGT